MADAQDRNIPASARKIAKARTEGQVPRSRDLGHLAALGIGVLLIAGMAPQLIVTLRAMLASALRFDAAQLANADAMQRQALDHSLVGLSLALPFGAAIIAGAIATVFLGGGWNFTLHPIQPKFSKLNPLTGLGRLFSTHQLIETLKSCLLAAVLLSVGALYVQSHLGEFLHIGARPLGGALVGSAELLRGALVALLLTLALFALVDVPLQRWRNLKQLKMTVEEAKQEHKNSEGNPEIKGKIRQRMRQMASRRMLAAVPEADLVVMNPTHYAVALKYDDKTMAAPRVIAKGADLLALRMREVAGEHRVPVLQAPPLARALYAHTEVDQEIPAALFSAVAQVLAWVYQLRAAAGAPLAAPQPELPPGLDPHEPGARRGRALRSAGA